LDNEKVNGKEAGISRVYRLLNAFQNTSLWSGVPHELHDMLWDHCLPLLKEIAATTTPGLKQFDDHRRRNPEDDRNDG
jgi:hypothetical protein